MNDFDQVVMFLPRDLTIYTNQDACALLDVPIMALRYLCQELLILDRASYSIVDLNICVEINKGTLSTNDKDLITQVL